MTQKRRGQGQKDGVRAATLAANADALSARLVAVTSPVYIADDAGLPSALGSAVGLEIGPVRFLVSAAHVFDQRRTENLYLHGSNGFVALRGDFMRLFRPGTQPADDPIDITVSRLDRFTAEELPNDEFAAWTELDHGSQAPSRDVFLAVGYPTNLQRNALKGEELRATAFRFAAKECQPDSYRLLNHDVRTSLLLGIDKKRMWTASGRVTAPDLNGMSGCGVWRVGPELTSSRFPPRLSAIAVEWRQRVAVKHVLATRIQPILGAIGSHYPDVGRIMALLP